MHTDTSPAHDSRAIHPGRDLLKFLFNHYRIHLRVLLCTASLASEGVGGPLVFDCSRTLFLSAGANSPGVFPKAV
jgi:hypothetical protein